MKVTLTYQNYGTSILIFIQGESLEDAKGQWLSLYNWGATSTEPRNVAKNVIACWSTLEKLRHYLFVINEHRLLSNRPANMGDEELKATAKYKAASDFANIEAEAFRSVNSNFEVYEMGTISAEKPDDDFKDSVMKYAFRD